MHPKLKRKYGTCFKCGESGHCVPECPKNQEDRNPQEEKTAKRSGKCYQCQEEGHWASECPRKETNRVGRCYKCQKEGHWVKDCKQEKKNIITKVSVQETLPCEENHRCLKCHNLGHGLFECTEQYAEYIPFNELTTVLFGNQQSWYWCREAAESFRRYREITKSSHQDA